MGAYSLKSFERQCIRPVLGAVRRGVTRCGGAPLVAGTAVALQSLKHVSRLLRRQVKSLRRARTIQWDDLGFGSIAVEEGEPSSGYPLGVGERTIYLFVGHTVSLPINTGVQRVVRELASSMVARHEQVRFVKWSESLRQCVLIDATERDHLAQWNGPAVGPQERAFYKQAHGAHGAFSKHSRAEHHWLVVPEVTHQLSGLVSQATMLIDWAREWGLRTGFLFYDAIPLLRDEYKSISAAHAEYMRQLFLADCVWPITQWSADSLSGFWHRELLADAASMPPVVVIRLPGTGLADGRPPNQPRASESLPPTILCVGSIEHRKQQFELAAWFINYKLRHPGSPWQLKFVGNINRENREAFQRLLVSESSLHFLEAASDEQLCQSYSESAFTVYPSVEEGFGLPILESLAFGKPCVCASFGAMGEVAAGGGCLTVDTQNQKLLGDAIESLMADPSAIERLTAEAIRRTGSTWAEYADALSASLAQDGSARSAVGTIYYWIDATVSLSGNTGIQRVARQLARRLLEQGARLIPVKYGEKGQVVAVSDAELRLFSQWNGPPPSAWTAWQEFSLAVAGRDWFVMPELPLNRSAQQRESILSQAHLAGLRCAAVFFDAIPWKMREIYPKNFADTHRASMEQLAAYDLVLPISQHSRNDLVAFLGAAIERPVGLEQFIKAAVLPGEFPECRRVYEPKIAGDTVTVLAVGTVEPRKNHLNLLAAFAAAADQSRVKLQLVIAGSGDSFAPDHAKAVQALIGHRTDIHWLQNVDDVRLRELYVECDFTMYPSIEEGFGLPILESLWHARPCVCANFGAMAEVAKGGGCLLVDTRSVLAITEAIVRLAEDPAERQRLAQDAMKRNLKTWRHYASEVLERLGESPGNIVIPSKPVRIEPMQLPARPKLSVCISTYNRAAWLDASLRNWVEINPQPREDVELLVCDNASTDDTPAVVERYAFRSDLTPHRNAMNVGMLGNLRETAQRARGDYVWIIGDDDLIFPESISNILAMLREHPKIPLVYLNYARTSEGDARTITDFKAFCARAKPMVPAEANRFGPIRTICARNENFFTAIYACVFRRDHAMRAYSRSTEGRAFASLAACVPTTCHVLEHMMDEPGVWMGQPQIVINTNVSWMRYAPLWILERVPEIYDCAERRGAASSEVDRWRRHTLKVVPHYFAEIYENDAAGNAPYFHPARVLRRFQHLPEFVDVESELCDIYTSAWQRGHPQAGLSPHVLFPKTSRRVPRAA